MRVKCHWCRQPIPKRRLDKFTPAQVERCFCSDACNLAYGNEALSMIHDSEQRAVEDLRGEYGDDWRKALRQQFTEAVDEGNDMTQVAARFLGKVAGHFGPRFAEKIYDRITTGIKGAAEAKPKPEPKPEPETKTPPPPSGSTPPPKTTPPPRPSSPPPPKTKARPKEPENLEDLPTKERKKWLMRRFYRLSPEASWEDVTKEWRALMKKYHPDNRETGNPAQATFINVTYEELKKIKEELGDHWA